MRGPPKKTGPVKKEWQVGRDNDSRSRRLRTAEAQTCAKDSTFGVDVVRCRRNRLANAPFPLDGVEPVDGVLPDLGFVEGCCDARQSCLNLLPYVGPGWSRRFRWPRCWTWASAAGTHRVGHLRAEPRGRGDAAARAGAHGRRLARGRGAHGQAQRERDDRPVGAQRSSSSELDGAGADFSQAFAYVSNGTYRPIHDAVLGFEHCMVAKARRILDAAALPGAGEDGLPADAAAAEALHGAAAGAGGAAPPGRHAGLPRGRDEAVAGQQLGAAHGGGAAQTTEVERGGRPYKPLPGGQLPAAHGPAGHWKDAPRSRSWTWRSGRTWPVWG